MFQYINAIEFSLRCGVCGKINGKVKKGEWGLVLEKKMECLMIEEYV